MVSVTSLDPPAGLVSGLGVALSRGDGRGPTRRSGIVRQRGKAVLLRGPARAIEAADPRRRPEAAGRSTTSGRDRLPRSGQALDEIGRLDRAQFRLEPR